MRPIPLTVLKGGINRMRIKGGASINQLYDLQNAYITVEGSVVPREGTIRYATLDSTTVGLAVLDGEFNVFSTALQTVPSGFTCNILAHPTLTTATLETIWFAKPFMGFLYVVAEFNTGDIYDYWLQNNGTWTSSSTYTSGAIILPDTTNGYAYLAVRDAKQNPLWTAQTIVATNTQVEPNEYTGFYYRAVAVAGANPHTSSTEPVWPTVAGGTVQEFGDFDLSATDAGTTSDGTVISSSTSIPLGANITDRYGNSTDIANAGTSAGAAIVTTATVSTNVTIWQPGTNYAPGAVVRPSTTQGAYTNAIPNGDFENGNDGNWIFSGTNDWEYATTNQYQGQYCLEYPATGSTASAAGDAATMLDYAVTTAGQSVTVTAYLNPNNSGANLVLEVGLFFYNASDTLISSGYSAAQEGGGYRLVSYTAIAPAGASQVKATIRAGTNTTSRNPGFADLISWNLEQPATISNFLYEAVQATAGASGNTQPSWPTSAGSTVIDGAVTWEAIGTSIITWEAIPLMYSGLTQPSWPTTIGNTVYDTSSYTDVNGVVLNTSMSWQTTNRQIIDTSHPNTIPTVIGASHVFKGNVDITSYSAAVDPTDWSSTNNAGYLPSGLNNYGDNPVAMLALYRSNLMVFNAGGYQMWQIDPDPQNMALLDAEPIGSIWPRAAQSVANDLLFLTEVGVRNIGTVGATANMAIGNTGQPVDPIVVPQMSAGVYSPISLYYPGRGQYWLIFGPQAFVLTINGSGQKNWSRYIFPQAITDWALNGETLFLRTSGNLVWQFDESTLYDDYFRGTETNTWTMTVGYAGFVIVGYNTYTSAPYGYTVGTTSPVLPAIGSADWAGFYYLTSNGNTPSYQMVFGGLEEGAFPNAFVLTETNTDTFVYTTWTYTWDGVSTFTAVPMQSGSGAVSYVVPSSGAGADGYWTVTIGVVSTLASCAPFALGNSHTYSLITTGTTHDTFDGVIQWPYLDLNSLAANKMMMGFDLVGDGVVSVQMGWNQQDPSTFCDAATFSTSSNVSSAYTLEIAGTVPGTPVPFPINAPAVTVILTFAGGQEWSWEAFNIYVIDQRGGGMYS